MINPPYREKYGYWTNDILAPDADDWFAGSEHHPGSWWPHWLEWVAHFSGGEVPARTPDEGKLPALEDAPGSYVKVKAADAAGC